MPRVAKSGHNVKPSQRAQKALELLASNAGLTIPEAMVQAGFSEKTAQNYKQNFVNLKSVQQVAQALNISFAARIGVDKVIAKIDEQMEAEKWYLSQTGPDFKDADYAARAKGIDLALKVLSFGQPTQTNQNNVQININTSKYTKE